MPGTPNGDLEKLLTRVTEAVVAQREAYTHDPVRADATLAELRAALGGPTPMRAAAVDDVVADLVRDAVPGLIGSPGPRYFGFVIGGSEPVALAADWLTSGWDNNAGLFAAASAASVIEETAGRWVVDLLGLPATASAGFVTGGRVGNVSGVAARRPAVWARAGDDVEAGGLHAAPRVRVIVGEERHATIDIALRYLGFGTASAERVPVDDQGRMRGDAL